MPYCCCCIPCCHICCCCHCCCCCMKKPPELLRARPPPPYCCCCCCCCCCWKVPPDQEELPVLHAALRCCSGLVHKSSVVPARTHTSRAGVLSGQTVVADRQEKQTMRNSPFSCRVAAC
jgi:hypothetical protein